MGEAEVPWDSIAFPAVADTLRRYFADLKTGRFPFRLADVVVSANNIRTIKVHQSGSH